MQMVFQKDSATLHTVSSARESGHWKSGVDKKSVLMVSVESELKTTNNPFSYYLLNN